MRAFRALFLFAVLGAVLVAALNAMTKRFLEGPTASAVTVAAAICLTAALIALVPLAVAVERFPDYLVPSGLGAMLIRLFLSLGAGAVYLHVYTPPDGPFMTAMVICYLLMLAVETAVTLHLVHRYWRPPHTG